MLPPRGGGHNDVRYQLNEYGLITFHDYQRIFSSRCKMWSLSWFCLYRSCNLHVICVYAHVLLFMHLTWLSAVSFIAKGKVKVKVKVRVHALDIASLRSESPPQKRSGMARVLKGFHSFTCIPTRSSAIGMSHAFAFPAAAGTHLPTPEGWKADCEVAHAEIRTCNLPIANPALYHTATSACLSHTATCHVTQWKFLKRCSDTDRWLSALSTNL